MSVFTHLENKIECSCGGTPRWRDCPRHDDADDVCFAVECPECLELDPDCEI